MPYSNGSHSDGALAGPQHSIADSMSKCLRYHGRMLPMIRALFHHQAWADAAMLGAVREHAGAADDEALFNTLHHIVLVQRAFLALFLERPFDVETESRVPASLAEVEALFREAHREEITFVESLEETSLSRIIELPWLKDSRPWLAEALMQVVLHSQNHRGQCASLLRRAGGTPPQTDFIIWIKGRPAAVWP